jgi:hypothetical protein
VLISGASAGKSPDPVTSGLPENETDTATAIDSGRWLWRYTQQRNLPPAQSHRKRWRRSVTGSLPCWRGGAFLHQERFSQGQDLGISRLKAATAFWHKGDCSDCM